MTRKSILVGIAGLCLALSSCTLTAKQEATVEKAYDTTCANEPAIYASFVTIATAKQVSEKTMQKGAAIHAAAVQLCETRPTDIASAAIQLSNLYAQLVIISAQVDRAPTPILPSPS